MPTPAIERFDGIEVNLNAFMNGFFIFGGNIGSTVTVRRGKASVNADSIQITNQYYGDGGGGPLLGTTITQNCLNTAVCDLRQTNTGLLVGGPPFIGIIATAQISVSGRFLTLVAETGRNPLVSG